MSVSCLGLSSLVLALLSFKWVTVSAFVVPPTVWLLFVCWRVELLCWLSELDVIRLDPLLLAFIPAVDPILYTHDKKNTVNIVPKMNVHVSRRKIKQGGKMVKTTGGPEKRARDNLKNVYQFLPFFVEWTVQNSFRGMMPLASVLVANDVKSLMVSFICILSRLFILPIHPLWLEIIWSCLNSSTYLLMMLIDWISTKTPSFNCLASLALHTVELQINWALNNNRVSPASGPTVVIDICRVETILFLAYSEYIIIKSVEQCLRFMIFLLLDSKIYAREIYVFTCTHTVTSACIHT